MLFRRNCLCKGALAHGILLDCTIIGLISTAGRGKGREEGSVMCIVYCVHQLLLNLPLINSSNGGGEMAGDGVMRE